MEQKKQRQQRGRVEMPQAAESWVQLHESELTELMQKQQRLQ